MLPQVVLVASNVGTAELLSAAHCIGQAATPQASPASQAKLEGLESLVVEVSPESEGLADSLGLED